MTLLLDKRGILLLTLKKNHDEKKLPTFNFHDDCPF
jgi:hypothetical protein